MPQPNRAWRHVVFSTYGQWLPGDRRGWRSRGHRRHSSGDYQSPPPPGEHAGLHRQARAQVGSAVTLTQAQCESTGRVLVDFWSGQGRLLALAVAPMHVHALVELPHDGAAARQVVGDGKRAASRALRDDRPGRVWAAGAALKMITDRRHQAATFDYICHRQGPTAWVWNFREGVIQPPGGPGMAGGSG